MGAYGPREVRDELSMNDFLREYLFLAAIEGMCPGLHMIMSRATPATTM
jgi:hypothetical protein